MSDVIKSPGIRRLEIIEITVFSTSSHTAHLSVFTMEAENPSQKLTIDQVSCFNIMNGTWAQWKHAVTRNIQPMSRAELVFKVDVIKKTTRTCLKSFDILCLWQRFSSSLRLNCIPHSFSKETCKSWHILVLTLVILIWNSYMLLIKWLLTFMDNDDWYFKIIPILALQ